MLAALASLSACSPPASSTEQPKTQPVQPVQVEVYRIELGAASGSIRASGLVAFKSETSLSFGAAGSIESLSAETGDRVRAGQVLATLRRTSVGADAAEAEVVARTAQQTFDRVSRLFEAGAASEADLDAARLQLEKSRETLTVIAPASGVILSRDVERGQVVTPGQVIFQVGGDRTGVVLRAQLSSSEVARVRLGDAATMNLQSGESRTGKVAQISPKMAAGMASFEVEIRFDDPRGLRSGEVAETLIAATPAAGAATSGVTIPAIALIDARADQGIVYVVEAGKNVAQRRAVQTEGVTDAGVIIIGGLTPGEAVITRGASMVRDGDPVSIKQD